jgi:aspartyl-tRNA(Asn)/glutamyl-tRNA(Gln) amidotransferase subunit A
VAPHDVLAGLKAGVKGLRLAFGETLFFDDVDPEIVAAVRATGDVFGRLGAPVGKVVTPEVAEMWADKARPLLGAAEACAVNGEFLDKHFDSLDPVVAHRMIAGRELRAPDYFATIRRMAGLRARVKETILDVDAVLVPTTLAPPRPIAEIDVSRETYMDANMRYLRNTTLGNMLNLCAVSVPCGFTRAGLPIGLMVYAKPFQEETALRVAYAYEQATEWHQRRPDLGWAAA